MIAAEALAARLVDHLPRQRWFGGDEADARRLRVVASEVLRGEWPQLVHVLFEVPPRDDSRGIATGIARGVAAATYQVVIGLRPVGGNDVFLEGKADAVLGIVEGDDGPVVAYDALVDPELALWLLHRAAPDERVERARLLGLDQSNSSVVFDERLIMKLFRRVAEGPHPDVEVTMALSAAGFAHVPRPVGEWRQDDGQLAVVTAFLADGVDGFHLALTSIRDLYDVRCNPRQAGGDFGPDAHRLGGITAQMHLALAEVFGTVSADVPAWVDEMSAGLVGADVPGVDHEAIQARFERLRDLDVGPAIRVHGDYHLGQCIRTDAGWYVLDFEGEVGRTIDERRRPSSPLRDVAGMLRSFHYAAEVGLREHGDDGVEELRVFALAWEHHVTEEFLRGYSQVDGIEAILPPTETARSGVMAAFELGKAVYEIGYEAAHRPDWIDIPLGAIDRILQETAS